MYQTVNLPLYSVTRQDYGSWGALRQDCSLLGCHGVEGIWAGEEIPADFPQDLLVGYHLTFFPDWLDFYREDRRALLRKFGDMETVRRFYGGTSPDLLLNLYREDLARARALGAKYVVFHVSDVSIEEGYTYRWLHSDEEVIDASLEVINSLLADVPADFEFLVENQWWPGFTMTEPDKTARLLEGIQFPCKGIMLDTGHLMNTNPSIRTQADGLAHLQEMVRRHGTLARAIRGFHLHQSLSGTYVRRNTGYLPADLPKDCVEQFGVSYGHIQQIDRHRPWTNPGIADFVQEVGPEYLTHELAAQNRRQRFSVLRRQMNTLKKNSRWA